MKTVKATLMAVMLLGSVTVFAQLKTDTLKVAGNCGMCKKHIEGASKAAGATAANWDKATHLLTISYTAGKTTVARVEKAVAAAGYDTIHLKGNDKAYAELDECCRYERTGVKNDK